LNLKKSRKRIYLILQEMKQAGIVAKPFLLIQGGMVAKTLKHF